MMGAHQGAEALSYKKLHCCYMLTAWQAWPGAARPIYPEHAHVHVKCV